MPFFRFISIETKLIKNLAFEIKLGVTIEVVSYFIPLKRTKPRKAYTK